MPDFPSSCSYYHGSFEPLPDTIRAGNETRWWRQIDHTVFLDPPWDDDDDGELGAELRTAYANIVFEAFQASEKSELRDMAATFGLSGLGAQVGILFVTDDRQYVERYGEAHEIDIDAEGVLDVLPDENASRPSWLIVMRTGSPFPAMAPMIGPAVRR